MKNSIIAVASGKGGVGKTWLSITLSHALARSGKRVLLFDGDIGLANVDVQLGLSPAFDLGAVIADRATLGRAVTRHPEMDVDVIAGASGSGNLSVLAPSRFADLMVELMTLSRNYDVTILDLGAGLDRMVRRMARMAGRSLVVTTDEPTSLTDAYAFIKTTATPETRDSISVVVNAAESPKEGERTYATISRACANFLAFEPPLAGVIRRDRKVADAIRHQSPMLARHPNSEASTDVEALARRIGGDLRVDAA